MGDTHQVNPGPARPRGGDLSLIPPHATPRLGKLHWENAQTLGKIHCFQPVLPTSQTQGSGVTAPSPQVPRLCAVDLPAPPGPVRQGPGPVSPWPPAQWRTLQPQGQGGGPRTCGAGLPLGGPGETGPGDLLHRPYSLCDLLIRDLVSAGSWGCLLPPHLIH